MALRPVIMSAVAVSVGSIVRGSLREPWELSWKAEGWEEVALVMSVSRVEGWGSVKEEVGERR
jgi:hypothetical protein